MVIPEILTENMTSSISPPEKKEENKKPQYDTEEPRLFQIDTNMSSKIETGQEKERNIKSMMQVLESLDSNYFGKDRNVRLIKQIWKIVLHLDKNPIEQQASWKEKAELAHLRGKLEFIQSKLEKDKGNLINALALWKNKDTETKSEKNKK